MSSLISKATGNFTAAGTWAVCDSTAELDSDTAAVTLTTANTDSTTFILPATAVDAVAIKISLIITPTGTLTVTLRNSTAGTTAGTVTINASDLASSALSGGTGANTGGWYVFPFASHTPNSFDSYLIRVVRSITDSGSSRISLCASTASALNICRQVRKTTTAAPGAGDKLIVAGEMTGAGTGNSFTVTMNNTASTSFGSTSFPQGIAIGNRGTLAYGSSASTAYTLKAAGVVRAHIGGTITMGTVGTPIPSTSSAELLFDVASNVDSGLVVDGSFTSYGASKTSWTKLTADKAAAATVIALTDTTGWAISDVLCFSSTSRTATESETKNVSTVDSSTQVTLTAGLTNAHLGTSPMQCECGNLTRNVKIHGTSTSLQGYIATGVTGVWSSTYTEIYNLGSGTASKRGIDIAMTSAGGGTTAFSNCAIHDFIVASSIGMNVSSSTHTGLSVDSCVIYNNASSGITIATTTGTWSITNNLVCAGGSSVTANDAGGTFTGNYLTSSTSSSITFSNTGDAPVAWNNNVIHSNAGGIVFTNGGVGGTSILFGSTNCWRNAGSGAITLGLPMDATFDSWQMWGNATAHIIHGTGNGVGAIFTNCNFSGDGTFATPTAFSLNIGLQKITCISCDFGSTTASTTSHTTADFTVASGTNNACMPNITLYNCNLRGTNPGGTEVSNFLTTTCALSSFISSQKHDQTTGLHKTYKPAGILTIDTTIYDVSPSLRMAPNTASFKLESGVWKASVASGATATFSAKVRKSVVGDGTAYNGNLPRLVLKKNVAAGIASDTVLATATVASVGAFETISGTTAAVTDDAVLSVVVDCDGTTGWVNTDTVSVS